MQFETLGLTGLFLSAFISSTIAPGGSEVLVAYMVSQQSSSIARIVIIATIGNTIGALTTWGLGFLTSRKYPADGMLKGRRQKSLTILRAYGKWALLFSWLPVVGDGLCFAGGWLKLSLLPSVAAILIGKAVRYVVVAYAFV